MSPTSTDFTSVVLINGNFLDKLTLHRFFCLDVTDEEKFFLILLHKGKGTYWRQNNVFGDLVFLFSVYLNCIVFFNIGRWKLVMEKASSTVSQLLPCLIWNPYLTLNSKLSFTVVSINPVFLRSNPSSPWQVQRKTHVLYQSLRYCRP